MPSLIPGGKLLRTANKVRKKSVALDTNAIIHLLEGKASEAATISTAIAGRTPQVARQAVKEFLRGGGNINALRSYLQNFGGKVASTAKRGTIKQLRKKGVKLGDARILGSAVDEGVELLTRDKKLIKKSSGVARLF